MQWNTCIRYLTREDPKAYWECSFIEGQGVAITVWQSTVPQPTEAELQAIEADAITWLDNKTKTEDADYEKWTKRERALCKLFVKEINKLRVKNGDEPYTPEQVKAALKAEME